MDFLVNINLKQNELQNAVIHPLSSSPLSGKMGQIYYNTSNKYLYQYDGTTWKPVGVEYELPIATSNILGGIKVGSGVEIDNNGTLSVPIDNSLSSTSTNPVQNKVINSALGNKANKATTLAGYGITDAKIVNGVITLGSATITPLTLSDVAITLANNLYEISIGDKTANNIATKNYVEQAISDIPKDQFLDLAKTKFVDPFTWSETLYPKSINPNLEGKPVLVLALTNSVDTTYSFLNMEKLIDIYKGESPIVVSGDTISHSDSGVTQGTAGEKTQQTPAFGETINVPYFTVNQKGHITEKGVSSVKIPNTIVSKTSSGLCPALPTTAGTTKYLREDGTWSVPPDTNTWNENKVNTAGYVSAPTSSNANKVWKTDANGNPAWRDDANTTYSVATQSANGLMSSDDKTKLDGIEAGANKYSLPTATSTTLGGVKSQTTGTTSGRDYKVQVNDDGTMKVNVPWTDTDTKYTLAELMGSSAKGGATQPVYWDGSKWTDTTYTLGKSVPSDAKFTDTTYSNFVKSGSSAKAGLVPAPSTTAGTTKYLREDGTWSVPPDTNTWRGIQDNLTSSTNTTESLSAKQGYLLANGSARDSTKLPLAGGTMTGNLNVPAVGKDGYIAYPKGGIRVGTSSSETGYLRITLPKSASDTMIKFKVSIYNYSEQSGSDYFIGGYNYHDTRWINTSAVSIGKGRMSNLPVQFGYASDKNVVYIGYSDTHWDYPQVTITDVMLGFLNRDYSYWAEGWTIDFTTSLGTITKTITNTSVTADFLPLSGGTLTGNLRLPAISSTNGIYKEIYIGKYTNDMLGIDTSTSDSDALKAVLKKICRDYPNESEVRFKGKFVPNSIGIFDVLIYDTNTVNSEGLPQYSFGTCTKYGSGFYKFGTTSFSYYFNLVNSGGNADTVDGQHFHWEGQGGQPTWVWGGWDYGNMYVFNPSNFSVNYANNADTVDGHHSTDFLYYGGNDLTLGQSSPASTYKERFMDNTAIPVGTIKMYYNSNGAEYSSIFSKGGSTSYGSILAWGYTDRYMRILRRQGGNWLSDDWEKMYAGYADSAGNADTVDGHHFNWSGQSGQPTWVWGGNDATNMYVWNPSNFSVNYANSAGRLTDLATADAASSTATWRRLWFAYNDNTTGRPAYDDRFAIQTSTGTLKAPNVSVTTINDKTPAYQGAHNNFIASGNEFTFVSSGFSGGVWLNYRTAGGTNGNITDYYFGNGKGGSLGTAIHSGNIGSQSVAYATNAGTVNNKTVGTNVPSDAKFTDTTPSVTVFTTGNITVAANSSTGAKTETIPTSVVPSGKTILGIVGYMPISPTSGSATNTSNYIFYGLNVIDRTVTYLIRNYASGQMYCRMQFRILYV